VDGFFTSGDAVDRAAEWDMRCAAPEGTGTQVILVEQETLRVFQLHIAFVV
jgi:hypothetical protein